MPTRKWWAARVTALAGLLIMFVATGGWGAEETVAIITLVSESLVSYLIPNESTPGGVPGR